MGRIGLALCLCVAIVFSVLADEPKKPTQIDSLRVAYRYDTEKCRFSTVDGQPLELVKERIMRWSNDDDWSGDVFAWTRKSRAEVLGCILSGPFGDMRYIYHEFHLLADKPIASTMVQDGRRWSPTNGLKRETL